MLILVMSVCSTRWASIIPCYLCISSAFLDPYPLDPNPSSTDIPARCSAFEARPCLPGAGTRGGCDWNLVLQHNQGWLVTRENYDHVCTGNPSLRHDYTSLWNSRLIMIGTAANLCMSSGARMLSVMVHSCAVVVLFSHCLRLHCKPLPSEQELLELV